MTTLADIALTVAKQLSRATADGTAILDLEAEIKDEIRNAVRFYNRRPMHLMEVRGGVLTTAAGATWYSKVDLENKSELITNGTFDTDLSGWTLQSNTDWSWVNGRAVLDSTASANSLMTQSFDLRGERTYSIKIEVLSGVSPKISFQHGFSPILPLLTIANGLSVGVHTLTGDLPDGYKTIRIDNSDSVTTETAIDAVSIREKSQSGGDQSLSGRNFVDVNSIINIHYMRENPGASGLNEPLSEVPYQHFERMFEGSTPQGQPEFFTRYAGQIGIWPTPAATHTIYWSGIVKPVVPSDDADTSVWFEQANELIEASAARRVCSKYLRDDQRAGGFAAEEKLAYDALKSEHVSKASTGRLRSHD